MQSTDSSRYFPYSFTGGKITRFLITTAMKMYIKGDLFTIQVLTRTFFCVLDDGIIKAFSTAFHIFIAVLTLVYILQIYLFRILIDCF